VGFFFFWLFFFGAGIESRALHMLGKLCTTEPPCGIFFGGDDTGV
jgi:hypothetical protein